MSHAALREEVLRLELRLPGLERASVLLSEAAMRALAEAEEAAESLAVLRAELAQAHARQHREELLREAARAAALPLPAAPLHLPHAPSTSSCADLWPASDALPLDGAASLLPALPLLHAWRAAAPEEPAARSPPSPALGASPLGLGHYPTPPTPPALALAAAAAAATAPGQVLGRPPLPPAPASAPWAARASPAAAAAAAAPPAAPPPAAPSRAPLLHPLTSPLHLRLPSAPAPGASEPGEASGGEGAEGEGGGASDASLAWHLKPRFIHPRHLELLARGVCLDYLQRTCKWGAHCRYLHGAAAAAAGSALPALPAQPLGGRGASAALVSVSPSAFRAVKATGRAAAHAVLVVAERAAERAAAQRAAEAAAARAAAPLPQPPAPAPQPQPQRPPPTPAAAAASAAAAAASAAALAAAAAAASLPRTAQLAAVAAKRAASAAASASLLGSVSPAQRAFAGALRAAASRDALVCLDHLSRWAVSGEAGALHEWVLSTRGWRSLGALLALCVEGGLEVRLSVKEDKGGGAGGELPVYVVCGGAACGEAPLRLCWGAVCTRGPSASRFSKDSHLGDALKRLASILESAEFPFIFFAQQ